MQIAMTTPAVRFASAVLAPAVRTSDVEDMEPPTGMPWKRLVARLAIPCPRKSAEASG